MDTLFYYQAYGLTLASAFAFPELVPSATPNDTSDVVFIREGAVSGLSPLALESGYCVEITDESALLYLGATAAIRVNAGREIIFQPVANATENNLRLFLLGPALAMVLHQRKQLVLHAGAMSFALPSGGPVAVGFLGESGQGKSTTAAALYERGHGVVADDIIGIRPNSEAQPLIYPGFPRLKLRPASVKALYQDQEALPLLDPENPCPRREKIAHRSFSLDLMPLQHLYVLEEGEEMRILPMSRAETLLALVRNSYWISDLPESQRKEHFLQCSSFIGRLAVFRLQRPRKIELLDAMLDMLESHVSTVNATQ